MLVRKLGLRLKNAGKEKKIYIIRNRDAMSSFRL